MTAVVFENNVGKFGDFQKYNGQNVEISGTITEYHNKPGNRFRIPAIKLKSSTRINNGNGCLMPGKQWPAFQPGRI